MARYSPEEDKEIVKFMIDKGENYKVITECCRAIAKQGGGELDRHWRSIYHRYSRYLAVDPDIHITDPELLEDFKFYLDTGKKPVKTSRNEGGESAKKEADDIEKENQSSPISVLKWSTSGGLIIEEEQFGEGASIKNGQTAYVLFEILLDDSKRVVIPRSSNPIKFRLGTSSIMIGMDTIVNGMKSGGRRCGKIPAKLTLDGDGGNYAGVPAGVDVICKIELVRFV